uniref:NADH dehydrogenase subunit 4L n=1 Tax=Eurylepta cornuta TaxID=1879303 RepID=A0A2R3SK56_9PLAT|nr:NADH dehydrogenase subunit 4L [Eurylepta cornuta]
MVSSLIFLLFILNGGLLIVRAKSILIMLFAFEVLILNIFLIYSFSNSLSDISSCLIFLSVVAGEASLGLSLLVSVVRSYGKDNNTNNNINCEGY